MGVGFPVYPTSEEKVILPSLSTSHTPSPATTSRLPSALNAGADVI